MLAQSIARCSCVAFFLGNVAAGRAFVVVVIDPIFDGLFHFVDGVERVNRHWPILLENSRVYQAAHVIEKVRVGKQGQGSGDHSNV